MMTEDQPVVDQTNTEAQSLPDEHVENKAEETIHEGEVSAQEGSPEIVDDASVDEENKISEKALQKRLARQKRNFERQRREDAEYFHEQLQVMKHHYEESPDITREEPDEITLAVEDVLKKRAEKANLLVQQQQNFTRQSQEKEWKGELTDAFEVGKEKIKDFAEVLLKSAITDEMLMVSSNFKDKSNLESFYYDLAKNHSSEISELSKRSPRAQIARIGRLHERFTKRPKKTISRAPAPVSPIKGSGSSIKSTWNMTPKEYVRHTRERQRR